MTGKCIFTSDGLWLTPIEFKIYSGSGSADWKSVIHVFTSNEIEEKSLYKKKNKTKPIKTLIDEKILTLKTGRGDTLEETEVFN